MGRTIKGNQKGNKIFLGSKDPTIAAPPTKGDDLIFALEGDDTVKADDGNDQIFGGFGKDTLSGEVGDDIIYGDSQKKAGESFPDGEATDQNSFEEFSEWFGLRSTPTDENSDKIDGGSGHDQIFGELNQDVLIGGTGNDLLNGGTGDDILLGGTRQAIDDANRVQSKDYDLLTGGEGKDTFVIGLAGHDLAVIQDFDLEDDQLAVETKLTYQNLTKDVTLGSTSIRAGTALEILDDNTRVGIIQGLSDDDVDALQKIAHADIKAKFDF